MKLKNLYAVFAVSAALSASVMFIAPGTALSGQNDNVILNKAETALTKPDLAFDGNSARKEEPPAVQAPLTAPGKTPILEVVKSTGTVTPAPPKPVLTLNTIKTDIVIGADGAMFAAMLGITGTMLFLAAAIAIVAVWLVS